ncbi:PEX5-related protein-like isoform X1 [Sinocyclocheilus anshuiensis]|uniref:PEX5-related protein-like isoform X1 n=1 Tax=Sinocyclocheilus anshuiensis TaxID=1608454 RepID=UPI0007B7F22B|nr:PREDICTED: PEX5-related protein-like isoform X1 [Sinocyclocheilus anshuiensis]
MYQGHSQGKDSRAVAMVLKELPSKASSDGKPLLTVTTKLCSEQQESRPLLSPSIDDFQSESKSDTSTRPVTSNTAALDLVDLSEPYERRWSWDRWSPRGSRKNGFSKSSLHKKKTEETELIQVETEPSSPSRSNPERASLDSVSNSPLAKWEEVSLHPDSALNGGRKWRYERKRCTSNHSSSELLWSADFKTDFSNRHSTLELSISTESDPGPAPQRQRPQLGGTLLGRQHSLEEEFVRAKAAVESDTEFWDKMQAEWEELARRNWLEDADSEGLVPLNFSPTEKGYYFHSNNPYKDYTNAFEQGLQKCRDGDLNSAVLLLEVSIVQDPQDSEAWQVLGTTQAENENEQAAIGCLQRCLELHPNNLKALMALAVSLTNTGQQPEACEALHRWIRYNPIYRHLLQDRSPLDGSPLPRRRGSSISPISTLGCSQLVEVLELYQEAMQQNAEGVDPDLQTGLGVLFNLSSEFDKAVDAFNAALSVRPEDYLLWNRLGATLANGDRSEEAVEAYTRALELQPGFIRSRYNLGISCINLGAHREAVSNFLTALHQQRKSRSHQVMSSNIWAALRIALSLMNQPELFQAASVGDLDLLMRAFNMDM